MERDLLRSKVHVLEEEKKAFALEITNQLKLSIVSRPLTRDEAAMEEDEEDDGNPMLGLTPGAQKIGSRVIPDFLIFGEETHIFLDPNDKSKFETIKTSELPEFKRKYMASLDEADQSPAKSGRPPLDAEATLDAAMALLMETVEGKKKAEKKLETVRASTRAAYEVFYVSFFPCVLVF